MMKMQIAIDEQRAIVDGVNPQDVYNIIDKIFFKVQATKEVLPDGTLEYTNNQNAPEEEVNDMGIAFYNLRHNDMFAKYCNKWLWLEEDEPLKFETSNVLLHEQKENKLFMR